MCVLQVFLANISVFRRDLREGLSAVVKAGSVLHKGRCILAIPLC